MDLYYEWKGLILHFLAYRQGYLLSLRGVAGENMEFPGGTGEMEKGISIKNNWEFPGVVKNKLFGIFKVLGFRP